MWADLLTEIQFAINVSPDTDTMPGLSPFQLVFGRRPRLSGKDITFPAKITPAYPVAKHHRGYVNALCKRLQQWRLAALDKQMQRKQVYRRRHDDNRPAPSKIQPKRGDLVYLNVPTSTPKVRYQWTQPVWLVVKASVTTVNLKPLVSAHGRKGLTPDIKVANRKKVRVAGPRPTDFWVGATVKRRFSNTWFLGTIFDMVTDEGRVYFKVQFKDGDQEELDTGEVWDSVIYHPRMDVAKYVPAELPKLQDLVLFADGQQPKVGEVQAVDENENLPVTLSLWKPSSKAKSLATARFAKSTDDNEDNLIRVRPEQILLQQIRMDAEGFLDEASKKQIRKLLRKPRARTQTNANAVKKTQTAKKPNAASSRLRTIRRPANTAKMISRPTNPKNSTGRRPPIAIAAKTTHARYHLRKR